MSLPGNIIWLIFGGFIAGLGYIFGGILLMITIIGIPFGIQAINLGLVTFAPFGKTLTQKNGGESSLALIFNIIWLILFGWEIAVAHITFGIVLALTIVGLPFAKQHFKLAPVALFPFTYTLGQHPYRIEKAKR